jgi:hypothetical protein
MSSECLCVASPQALFDLRKTLKEAVFYAHRNQLHEALQASLS